MNKKIWIPILRLAAAALAAELFVCNFSAWKSLFYKERNTFENVSVEGCIETETGSGAYTVPDGILTLHIADVDKKIHNLLFALHFSENTIVPYTVTLTDEGNYYPYSLPEKVLIPDVKKSFYTNIYPAGKTETREVQFTVPAGSVVTISGIGVNARIPFLFSLGRFLFILGVMLLLYQVRHVDAWKNVLCTGTKKQCIFTVAIIILLMGMAWMLTQRRQYFQLFSAA